MSDRLKQLRAGMLLVLSSAVLFWPISYWLPLPEYLLVLASEDYADYSFALRTIVFIYLTFFLLNLISAFLTATKISHTLKFWLSAGPALILLVVPFILVAPTAFRFSERNYFDIFQAMYRLLRFTTSELLALALVCTFTSVALNFGAALLFRSASDSSSSDSKSTRRFSIYVGVSVVAIAVMVFLGSYNGDLRSQDRAACNRYAALEVPEVNEDVPGYLTEIRFIGESAGNTSLQKLFTNFSKVSGEYLLLLESEPQGSDLLKQAEDRTTEARDDLAKACSEYSVG